ncbi:hypothetical protein [Flavobacterium aestivum]|uniref:hypothetical protein n=1 Tax=Flavobacterium aestivum TaxID=3003257 RepID=UPI0024822CDE|nr:hypothetical protein [Flavobacterium aestivum]
MKKIITLLCISFFTLVSCSSNEDAPIVVPSATAAHAELNGGSIDVTWPAVEGTGITYNVYRNDSPLKLNTVPLTEAKFTDVLTATGTYTYTITVNLSGLESSKGIASEKVVLDLPKTTIVESYTYSISNGVTTTTIHKDVNVLTYDSANIAKLNSVSTTSSDSGSMVVSKRKEVYTYSGNLITKQETVDVADVVQSSRVYVYNDKNKMTSSVYTTSKGNVYKWVYVYNADGTVTSTLYGISMSGMVTPSGNTNVYTFLNGNLVKDVSTYTSTNYTSTSTKVYVFDTKNNPTKYTLGFSNLFGEVANLNNVISSVYTLSPSTTSVRNEITYNANGNILTKKVFSKEDNLPEQLSTTITYTY